MGELRRRRRRPRLDHGCVLPVTVVIARTPAVGRADDLVAWAHGVAEAAESFDGHLGARIFRTGDEASDDVVVAFSFDNAEHLNDWEASDERRSWLGRLEGMVEGSATTHSVSGFEAIFSKNQGAAIVPPARWKTALIIALALYPMSVLLSLASRSSHRLVAPARALAPDHSSDRSLHGVGGRAIPDEMAAWLALPRVSVAGQRIGKGSARTFRHAERASTTVAPVSGGWFVTERDFGHECACLFLSAEPRR